MQIVSDTRLLIVDDIHPIFIERMEKLGVRVDYFPDIDRKGTLEILSAYDILVVRSKFKVDRDMLNTASRLKYVARAGAGMDNIDEVAAADYGVTLVNAPEGNRDAVGEHMIGMLLALINKLRQGDREIRKGNWLREEHRGVELGGRTVGLIGYGNNGGAMARKLSGFDVTVLAYDKYKKNFSDAFVKEASMEEIFEQADVLSLHIPLTSESRNLVNKTFIANFRKPFYFLNGARGEITVVEDVLEAITDNKIEGACFDVLPEEKVPNLLKASWYDRLVQEERVLLSPHVAGWTVESYKKIATVLADKLTAFLQ